MAILVNGNGNPAVYASQDAALLEGLSGDKTKIMNVGYDFEYEIPDANTIRFKDGVIITKEGRRIQLGTNQVDDVTVPTGEQGTIKYYITGYRLYVDNLTGEEKCETFIQEMADGTSTITEGRLKDGDSEVFVSVYRLKQTGLSFEVQDELLEVSDSLEDIYNINVKRKWNYLAGPLATDWSQSTTTIDGTAYFTAEITLQEVYSDRVEVSIAAAVGNTLPTEQESEDYNKVNFVMLDEENSKLKLYATEVPTGQIFFYIKGAK